MTTPTRRTGARAPATRFLCALACALGLAACGAANDRGAGGEKSAPRGAPVAATQAVKPGLVDPRPLQGAGAVAFDPARPRLAWAAGEEVRVFDLAAGAEERRIAIGSWVDDVAVAPDGAVWVVAGVPQLWRDGAEACRAEGVEADRLLAVDGEGAVVAGYSHSDGVGMLRRQVWLDAQCGQAQEDTDRVADGVTDAEADPGAPLGRASLQRVHASAQALAERLSGMQLPAGAGVERAVAISSDGRWWVLEGAQGRTLWRTDRP